MQKKSEKSNKILKHYCYLTFVTYKTASKGKYKAFVGLMIFISRGRDAIQGSFS